MAHYDGTAEEILEQCGGHLDYIVLTAGTGGTVTGIARKLKERLPHVKVIGVDPQGSILAQPDSLNGPISSYKVEGIGYDFIPNVLDRELVDEWIKTEDKESFLMARRLIKEEGLLCGGSSGSAVVAALQVARKLNEKQRMVVLLPDSVRNYMSKFLSDEWMIQNGFMSPLAREQMHISTSQSSEWWASRTVRELKLQTPFTVSPTVTCADAVEILHKQGFDQLPVIDDKNNIVGTVTLGNLMSQIVSKRVKPADPVSKCCYMKFSVVTSQTSLGVLSKLFDKGHFALVVEIQKCFTSINHCVEKRFVTGVVTRIDLLKFILENKTTTS